MAPDDLPAARQALVAGDWETARELFERVLQHGTSAEALDGLGQALWWLGDDARCAELRGRAYAAFLEEGRPDRAGEAAVYVAAHYRIAGNRSLADGWLGRAERALAGCGSCLGRGWLAVERAKRAQDPREIERQGAEAVAIGRAIPDEGIQAAGLGQQGLARVLQGDAAGGLELLDEAILVALGAHSEDPLAISDACCTTLVASELLVDVQRGLGWASAVSEFVERRGFLPIAAWCRAVYARFLIARGHYEEAERELRAARAHEQAESHGGDAAARVRLADLRLRQGRVAEARTLLEGLEDRAAALETVVRLHVADGDVELARERVERRLEAVGGAPTVAAGLQALLAEVQLAAGRPEEAANTAALLGEAGRALGRRDLAAVAAVLAARAARCAGRAADPDAVESAVEAFDELGLPLEACEARMEVARALAAARPRLAAEQARAAHAVARRLGAARHADEAAALLRELGAPPGPPPRTDAELTRREQEVLELLAEGLSNPEIADRLVLSPKTVEHHVSRVLAKLGVRNRAEAAAVAARSGG